jgi:ElaB/YqjD/DUF883 family membrane-anchored ribosome-binding protein
MTSPRKVRARASRGLPAKSSPVLSSNLNPANTMSTKSHTTDETHQDLKDLIQEAEQALGNTAGEAGEKFEELRERLRAAIDHGRSTFENLRSETVRHAKQADTLIRDNPYYAIGVAAGVGALIGILVSRSCQQSR